MSNNIVQRDWIPNPTGRGGFQPGQSGNPKGRPPKERAIAELIRQALTTPNDVTGEAPGKVLVQRALDALFTGAVKLDGDTELKIADSAEWLRLLLALIRHVEGSAPTEINIDSEKRELTVVYTTHWNGKPKDAEADERD